MITFVEYVCERLMGPPVHGSSWRCPFHSPDNNPSFSVRPPKRRPDGGWYPIKFRCFACGQWGDERDLLIHFYPNDTNQQRAIRWNELRADYEQLTGKSATANSTSYISSGKRGLEQDALRFSLAELRSVLRERQMKWRREEAGLRVLVWASAIADDNGVTLEELARHCASELIQAGAAKC